MRLVKGFLERQKDCVELAAVQEFVELG